MLSCLPSVTVKDKPISPPHLWHHSDHSWFISSLHPPTLGDLSRSRFHLTVRQKTFFWIQLSEEQPSVVTKSISFAAFRHPNINSVYFTVPQPLHVPARRLTSLGNPHINQWAIQMVHGLHHHNRTALIGPYLSNGRSGQSAAVGGSCGKKKRISTETEKDFEPQLTSANNWAHQLWN